MMPRPPEKRGVVHSPRKRPRVGRARKAAFDDERMMREALALAQQAAERGEVPVGALVVRNGQIIGRGANTREAERDPIGHAEILAIAEACREIGDWRLNDCTLYVTLEPCPMCAGAIVNARVGRLVYGATDPKAGAVETLYRICTDQRLNHRVNVTAGVLARECGGVLSQFFRNRRRAKR
jgi:tRNA(adenine34) deaminase